MWFVSLENLAGAYCIVDSAISCPKARTAAQRNRNTALASSSPVGKQEKEQMDGVQYSREVVSVSVHSRNNSAPLTFDRSSILRSRIVRSLFPALGCCRNEDEGRSGLDENCLDTQQEKHDTGLAESYPNPKETALSGHPSI